MRRDHYAILGVSPTSQDVVIRAAYRALMRLYHPDANSSADAAARARELTAAYAVLGNPAARAHYDAQRLRIDENRTARTRPPGFFFGLSSAGVLGAAILVFFLAPATAPAGGDRVPAAAATGASAAKRAQWPERDLPRLIPERPEALESRPSGNRPAVETPILADGDLPDVEMTGSVAAPGMERLASLPRAETKPPVRERAAPPPRRLASAAVSQAASAEPTAPSFSCEVAQTSGERAVCNSSQLSALDRRMALLYAQSWSHADLSKRTRLLSKHERFIAQRDGCRSESCKSGVYLAYLREISEVMAAGH